MTKPLEKIRYAFIGGVAVSLLGKPRVTQDVDSLIWMKDDGELEKLLKSAAKHHLEPRMKGALAFARRHRVLLLTHVPSKIEVDVSLGTLPFEDALLKKTVKIKINDVLVPIPSPSNLIIMKAVAHRPKDMADIEGVLDACRNIDAAMIRSSLKEFSDLLEAPELFNDVDALLRRRGF